MSSVKQYYKLPKNIDALQWTGDNMDEVKAFCPVAWIDPDNYPITKIVVKTLEGVIAGERGCYIIRGIKGEFYPCEQEIFEESYRLFDPSRFLENLDFGTALKYVKKGFAIQRKGWNGKGMFVAYTPSKRIEPKQLWGEANHAFYLKRISLETVDYLTLKMADDSLMIGWSPNPKDMFTNDWQVIDPAFERVLTEGEAE